MKRISEKSLDVETWEEAHFLAELDYALNRGNEIEVGYVVVMEDDDTKDVLGPFRVRLDFTNKGCLHNACDEYLDPVWDVTSLEADGPIGPWTHGPSYRVLESTRHRMP